MIDCVKKALDILSALADGEQSPVTVSRLAEIVGINRSTCCRILSTLKECGYVEHVSHSAGYILGPEAYLLSRFGKYDETLISICKPIMNWLYKKTGKTIILSTIKNGVKFVVEAIDKNQEIFKGNLTIRRDNIYHTATGRILLANMDKNDAVAVYRKSGTPPKSWWGDIGCEEDFLKKLAQINKKGPIKSEYINEKTGDCTIGFGAALYKGTKCIGAIGVALHTERDADVSEELAEIEKNLRIAAREINRRLSYN